MEQQNKLLIKNKKLAIQIKEVQTRLDLVSNHAHNLESVLNDRIKSSHFFKLWQDYNKIKKISISILRYYLYKNNAYNSSSIDEQFQLWLEKNYPSDSIIRYQMILSNKLTTSPKILLITLLDTNRVNKIYLDLYISSLLDQSYPKWEQLFIVTNKRLYSQIKQILKGETSLIKIRFCDKLSSFKSIINDSYNYDYLCFTKYYDYIWPNALYEFANCINTDKNIDIIYSDEDRITIDGKTHYDPFFKPDFSVDLLYSVNYIRNLTLIKKDIINSIDFTSSLCNINSSNYLFILKAIKIAKKIKHLAKIIYSERETNRQSNPTKVDSIKVVKKQILLNLKEKGLNADVEISPSKESFNIKYILDKHPLVSIIIPTKDQSAMLKHCLDGVLNQSYKNIEIIIASNNSSESETFNYFNELQKNPSINIYEYNIPFNISQIFNFAVTKARGEYILLLNNDIEAVTKDWLSRMVSIIQRKDVGGVGVKLLYPNGLIQHAGVVLGIKNKIKEKGVAGHIFSGLKNDNSNNPPRYYLCNLLRNWSAVTGACFLTKKKLYQDVKGFEEKNLKILFSDIDYCLKLREKDYLIVYEPNIVMIHHESMSIGKVSDSNRKVNLKEIQYMRRRWRKIIDNDPFYNPNLSLVGTNANILDIENEIVTNPIYDLRIFQLMQKTIKLLKNEGIAGLFNKISKRNLIYNQIEEYNRQYKIWINNIERRRSVFVKKQLQTINYKPKISILLPTYNSNIDWFRKCIKSVLNQFYSNWELCIVDDASTNAVLINYLKSIKHPQIKIIFNKINQGIAISTNIALSLATGNYIALLDHDDELAPHALAEVALLLNQYPDTDMIYSDEDKIDEKNDIRCDPFFKPDWSPDYFLSSMYTSHLGIYKTELAKKIKGFRKIFEGSQDYDFVLRLTEKTTEIRHIPQILYHWRKVHNSTALNYNSKEYARESTRKLLIDTIKRRNIKGSLENGLQPDLFRIRYKIIKKPLVSIIILTKNKREYLKKTVDSILSKTHYQNYEIIIVDNNSDEYLTLCYLDSLKNDKKIFTIHYRKDFNFSEMNNIAVNQCKGEYIVLLNNDTVVISPDWLESMLEHAQRPEIGAVGAKLLYPDQRTQHCGIILGIGGIAGHAQKLFPNNEPGRLPIFNTKDVVRNWSAVTAACLMISKDKYLIVGGMDPSLKIAYNDIDFCLKLRRKGYLNIYTPYAILYHYESISVSKPESGLRNLATLKLETAIITKRWKNIIQNDPYYNQNLTLESEDFGITLSNRSKKTHSILK